MVNVDECSIVAECSNRECTIARVRHSSGDKRLCLLNFWQRQGQKWTFIRRPIRFLSSDMRLCDIDVTVTLMWQSHWKAIIRLIHEFFRARQPLIKIDKRDKKIFEKHICARHSYVSRRGHFVVEQTRFGQIKQVWADARINKRRLNWY